ncbi:MAG: AsmA family protein [Alphaproteobacteria bacterium]|jgi:hypothetical protein
MRRLRRRNFYKFARIFAMFFIGLLVSLAIALSRVNLETLRDEISNTLSEKVGMPVEIRGKVFWKFSLVPRVVLSDVVIKSKDWAKHQDGINIKLIEARLNLISLLGSNTSIKDIILINPIVYLEKNINGDISLGLKPETELSDADNPPSKFPIDIDFGIDSILMENPKLVYITPDSIENYKAKKITLTHKKLDDFIEYSGKIYLNDQDYSFAISISQLDEKRGVYPLNIAIVNKFSPLIINVALDKANLIPTDFSIRGKINDARTLFKNIGIGIPKISPMRVDIVGILGQKKLTLKKLSILFDNSDIKLSGSYSWKHNKPYISLNIKSEKFNLYEVFPETYGYWQRPNRELYVFKNAPLYSESWDDIDFDLMINSKKFVFYRDMYVENTEIKTSLNNSSLSIMADTGFANGRVLAGLQAHDSKGVAIVRAATTAKGISIGKILEGVREKNFISGLPVDLDLYVEGQGRDMSELMGSLYGPLQVRSSGSGTALPDASEYIYGRDFLTSVRHNIHDMLTINNKYDKVAISCAVVNLKLRNGRIETNKGVVLQMRDVNMRAVGFVDLGKETLHISLASTPVRGIRLSISGNILNAMEFSGNLAEPDIKLNNRSIITRTATTTGLGMLVLAPFTGGLSIAAGVGVGFLAGDLLNNWLSDDKPCETALKDGVSEEGGDPEFMNRSLDELTGEIIK